MSERSTSELRPAPLIPNLGVHIIIKMKHIPYFCILYLRMPKRFTEWLPSVRLFIWFVCSTYETGTVNKIGFAKQMDSEYWWQEVGYELHWTNVVRKQHLFHCGWFIFVYVTVCLYVHDYYLLQDNMVFGRSYLANHIMCGPCQWAKSISYMKLIKESAEYVAKYKGKNCGLYPSNLNH